MLCRSKPWQGLPSKAQMWHQHHVKPKVDVVKLESQHLEQPPPRKITIANTCNESVQMFGNSKLCLVDNIAPLRWKNTVWPDQHDIRMTNNPNKVDLGQASTQVSCPLSEQEWSNIFGWDLDVNPQKMNFNKNEIMGASHAATTRGHNFKNKCQYHISNTNDAKMFVNTYHGNPQGEELFLERFSTTTEGKRAPVYVPNQRIDKLRPLQTSKA